MNNRTSIALLSASAIVAAATCAGAQEAFFERISTYPVFWNLPAGTDPSTATVAEIVTATGDGRMLIHSDSPGEAIGFIDISDPTTPTGAGRVEMGGEPTSVVALGAYVFVGVNTSESFVEPGGHVAVVDIATREIVATCDVAGQPDALAVSPDGTYLAVAVENERDEDINDGVIPQLPAGHLAVISLGADGMPSNCNDAVIVGLTGLAAVAPTDPEPEYVDINRDNLAVVTLQENNHIVVVDLASGDIVNHFSAGTVDLDRVDVAEDGVIAPTATLTGVPREPDAVQWIDEARFVTADEGDYGGGSRGFTIFNIDGTVEYAAGSNFEHLGMFIGHYPEGRSDAKGTEPEGAEVGTFGDYTLIFVGSERANFVVVFRDRGPGAEPEILQVLPTNIGPEGLLAIPSRGLLVVASEEDAAEDGIRSTVSLYAMTAATPSYPQIVSTIDDMTGGPIGWGALSALVADDESATTLYAVNDSAYAESRIYAIDVGQSPAVITGYVTLTFEGAVKQYDPEGIALRAGGGFWVASEGNADRPNLLLAVTEDGTVEQEIGLPESVVANQVNNGFEGVASWMEGGSEHVIVAFQREWQDDPDNHVKLGIYDPASGEWSFVAYELAAPSSPNGGWVGLSEITHLGGSRFAIIERDNQPGVYSTYKVITVIDLASAAPVAAGEPLNVVEKTIVVDILSEMRAANGWISDKPEGLAVAGDGRVYLVIDNDGVDDAPGETQFITLGTAADLFP